MRRGKEERRYRACLWRKVQCSYSSLIPLRNTGSKCSYPWPVPFSYHIGTEKPGCLDFYFHSYLVERFSQGTLILLGQQWKGQRSNKVCRQCSASIGCITRVVYNEGVRPRGHGGTSTAPATWSLKGSSFVYEGNWHFQVSVMCLEWWWSLAHLIPIIIRHSRDSLSIF